MLEHSIWAPIYFLCIKITYGMLNRKSCGANYDADNGTLLKGSINRNVKCNSPV